MEVRGRRVWFVVYGSITGNGVVCSMAVPGETGWHICQQTYNYVSLISHSSTLGSRCVQQESSAASCEGVACEGVAVSSS